MNSHGFDMPAPVSRGPLRVLLVDDHEILRRGVLQLLTRETDMRVVGEAATGEEALRLAEHLRPDAVVMDVSLPGISGVETTRRLTTLQPDVRVVGLSMHEELDMTTAMRKAGATGVVPKIGDPAELVQAIRAGAA